MCVSPTKAGVGSCPWCIRTKYEAGAWSCTTIRSRSLRRWSNHPPVVPSFAYRFDAADRSIVISGDTAPSDALVKLASGADVLVHSVMYPPAIDRLAARVPDAAALKTSILAHQTSAEDAGRIARRPASRRSCFRTSFRRMIRRLRIKCGAMPHACTSEEPSSLEKTCWKSDAEGGGFAPPCADC